MRLSFSKAKRIIGSMSADDFPNFEFQPDGRNIIIGTQKKTGLAVAFSLNQIDSCSDFKQQFRHDMALAQMQADLFKAGYHVKPIPSFPEVPGSWPAVHVEQDGKFHNYVTVNPHQLDYKNPVLDYGVWSVDVPVHDPSCSSGYTYKSTEVPSDQLEQLGQIFERHNGQLTRDLDSQQCWKQMQPVLEVMHPGISFRYNYRESEDSITATHGPEKVVYCRSANGSIWHEKVPREAVLFPQIWVRKVPNTPLVETFQENPFAELEKRGLKLPILIPQSQEMDEAVGIEL